MSSLDALSTYTTGSWVKVDNLEPVFSNRLAAALADEHLGGRYRIYSGERSFEKQLGLYQAFTNDPKHNNLAASPYQSFLRVSRVTGLTWVIMGSAHMIQSDGYAHAVDLSGPSDDASLSLLRGVLWDYGLINTVATEWWHWESDRTISTIWDDGKYLEGQPPVTPPVEAPLDEEESVQFLVFVNNDTAGAWVSVDTLCRCTTWVRSGDTVQMLRAAGIKSIEASTEQVRSMLVDFPGRGPSPDTGSLKGAW